MWENKIKAHRKNLGLTQRELGFVLGKDNNSRVSELEDSKKEPSARELITLKLVCDKATSRLFPDLYYEITNHVNQRLQLLEAHLYETDRTPEIERTILKIHDIRQMLTEVNEGRV